MRTPPERSPCSHGPDPGGAARERDRTVLARGVGLDVDLFPAAWRPLVAGLAGEPGVDVEPGGDVAADGRAIGTYVVELRRGGTSVRLVGAGSTAAAAALQRAGHRVLALDPGKPQAAATVRQLLGLEA